MSQNIKYFYKGKETDLIVFASSSEAVEEYKKDPKPSKLTEVVEVFKVFSNRDGKGNEGEIGEASDMQIENEFGKCHIEDAIKRVLLEGECKGAYDAHHRYKVMHQDR